MTIKLTHCMRNNQLSLALITSLLVSYSASANECPTPILSDVKSNYASTDGIEVWSEKAKISQDQFAEFSGNVEILGSESKLSANVAFLDRLTRTIAASKDIVYQSSDIRVLGEKASIDVASGQLSFTDTAFEMLGFNGRGTADSIKLDETNGVLLEGLSFSSCPDQQKDWELRADAFQIKPGDTMATTRGTRFYVADVPVFYFPYFSFPATSLRQSGLLFPKITNRERTGFSYEQPYYFNIAPQIDATVSPRLMATAGLQMKSELRYLTAVHDGQVTLEYLDDNNLSGADSNRYFSRLLHKAKLSEYWTLTADINHISDSNYITDLGSEIYSRTDTHLPQRMNVNYVTDDMFLDISVSDFAVLGDHQDSYRTQPELVFDYNAIDGKYLALNIHSEVAHFTSSDERLPTATRAHIEPTLIFPYRKPWGEILAETTLFHTEYQQQNIENTELEKRVSRSLWQGRLYAQLNFERDVSLFGNSVTQTLEPKIQYLYTQHTSQQNIGIYDSTAMLNDFNGLFRGREFTGLDRINHNDQFTLGVTSRLTGDNDEEIMQLSLGQIFNLNQYSIDDVNAHKEDDDKSSLAAELRWNVSERWTLQSQLQLSNKNSTIEKNNITLDYRVGDGKLLQLSHRFVEQLSQEKIQQTGAVIAWPLAKNWHGVMRLYYDASQKRMIESYYGLQYQSCCWTVQINGGRSLTNRFNENTNIDSGEFDTTFSVNFIFKGLGNESNYMDLLRGGLFGYHRPYSLN